MSPCMLCFSYAHRFEAPLLLQGDKEKPGGRFEVCMSLTLEKNGSFFKQMRIVFGVNLLCTCVKELVGCITTTKKSSFFS